MNKLVASMMGVLVWIGAAQASVVGHLSYGVPAQLAGGAMGWKCVYQLPTGQVEIYRVTSCPSEMTFN